MLSDVELVVKLAPGMSASSRYDRLVAAMAKLGVRLELNGPRAAVAADDYHVALVGGDVAERVIDQVRKLDGVEAAFIKSRGEAPAGKVPND